MGCQKEKQLVIIKAYEEFPVKINTHLVLKLNASSPVTYFVESYCL
jgi:hypothetical protein